MIIVSTIPVLKNISMTLLHIPNEEILKKKKIEQHIRSLKCPSIGNFDLWQINSQNFVGEIKIDILKEKNEDEENEKNDKLIKENILFFEIQSKIQGIFKDNEINEYYIELV